MLLWEWAVVIDAEPRGRRHAGLRSPQAHHGEGRKCHCCCCGGPERYPLFECAMQAKDAQAVLSDVADDLHTSL